MSEIRHCLMAGMCQSAEEVPDMQFKTTDPNYGWECCSSTSRSSHSSSCISSQIDPARFRCPATVGANEFCERKWMEGLS